MTRDPAAKEGRGHTREPWTANFTRYDGGVEGFHIAGVERGSSYEICGFVLQKGDNPAEAEANARRIVACVNACEGIPDADLDNGPSAKVHSLLAQRDHLRERVKGLEEALEDIAANSDESDEWDAVHKLRENETRARAALSKSPK